jgi:hypothetical protein
MGGRGIQGAKRVGVLSDIQSARRTAGMFAQVTLNVADRLWFPFSVRTDAGNALGSQSRPIFPRVGFSYLASDEPMFRNFPLVGRLPELRLRTAFGIAGRQPGLADKQRTFQFSKYPINNINAEIADINSVGNAKLSPEISREWELGFDATFLDNPRGRLSGTFTLARTHTSDLLEQELLPPSIGVQQRMSNIGDAVNNNVEISLEGFRKIGALDWTTLNSISTQQGKLVKIRNSTVSRSPGGTKGEVFYMHRVGYPLNSVWAFPILGFVDGNQDGLLQVDEITYGDSVRYIGNPSPRFTVSSQNEITIASRLTISAVLSYEDGSSPSQGGNPDLYSRWNNAPLSLDDQVKLMYDAFADAYRVSTLRFQSLQVTYNVPTRIAARYLRMRSVQVALNGTNLGLWSTFSGSDPDIGGINRDQREAVRLPVPRTYGIRVTVQ